MSDFKQLRCPSCGAALKREGRGPDGLLLCRDCGPYPVISGVPVLLQGPADWCASHFDAAVSTLAEQQRMTPGAVAILAGFRDQVAHVTPLPFADDWTVGELRRGAQTGWLEGPAKEALDELSAVHAHQAPAQWLLHRVPKAQRILEIGSGAGLLSQALQQSARQLWVGDTSLRAVLNSVRHAPRAMPVVMNAESIPFKKGTLDVIVAEHVVDLLSAPLAFLESACAALRSKGSLLISTPDPSLGRVDDDSEEHLLTLADEAGFTLTDESDGLPWLRHHSRRRAELYLVKTCAFEKR